MNVSLFFLHCSLLNAVAGRGYSNVLPIVDLSATLAFMYDNPLGMILSSHCLIFFKSFSICGFSSPVTVCITPSVSLATVGSSCFI